MPQICWDSNPVPAAASRWRPTPHPGRRPWTPAGHILAALGVAAVAVVAPLPLAAQSPLAAEIDRRASAIEAKVVEWRRDIHANPELSNREFRTAALVADHLRGLGLDEVRTEVAHTGVVGILRGGAAGSGGGPPGRHGCPPSH